MKIPKFRYEQILETTKTLINEYLECLDQNDKEKVEYVIRELANLTLEEIEKVLLPTIEKVWNQELLADKYVIISWNKYRESKPKDTIVFATLCEKNRIVPFCNLSDGTLYKINFKALLGGCYKDGATLIEDKSRMNQYTVGIIGDKVINSYNGATKLITPKQLVDIKENNYQSKHNELILDSRYIQEIGPYEIKNGIKRM